MISSILTSTGLQAQKVLAQNTVDKTTAGAASTAKAEPETQTANLVFKPGTGFRDNNAFALVAEASADGPEKATQRGPEVKNGFDIFSVQRNGAQRQLQALLSLSTLNDLDHLLSLNATESAPDTDEGASAELADMSATDGGIASAGSVSVTPVSGDSGGGSTGDTGTGGGSADTGITGDTGSTATEPVPGKVNRGSVKGGPKK